MENEKWGLDHDNYEATALRIPIKNGRVVWHVEPEK